MNLVAPFPFFGGKRSIAPLVWERLGAPKQYIEPFCGSAAMLLAAPRPASLEVIGDVNGYVANFWRATAHQPARVAHWADYPVSHVDLGARHAWLLARREALADGLRDADWPGDAKAAGWWLWGQCCWIGSGWCDWQRTRPLPNGDGQVPHISDAGRGVQAVGKVPHTSDAELEGYLTSGGRAAHVWLHRLADRLERVRVVHGSWERCLNHHYGSNNNGIVAVVLDPPYRAYEALYGAARPVADEVEQWAREHAHLRIALCGLAGDYALPGWAVLPWQRKSLTYSNDKTRGAECVWFSPACLRPDKAQVEIEL